MRMKRWLQRGRKNGSQENECVRTHRLDHMSQKMQNSVLGNEKAAENSSHNLGYVSSLSSWSMRAEK